MSSTTIFGWKSKLEFLLREKNSQKNSQILSTFTWLICLINCLRIEILLKIKPLCNEVWSSLIKRKPLISCFCYFIYRKIAYVVFGRPVAANQDQVRAHQSKQKMIKMMILVCVVYSLCWLPINLLIVISDVYENIWQFK